MTDVDVVRAAIRAGLMAVYRDQAAMLRELATAPAVQRLTGPEALESAARMVERAAEVVRDD